MHNSILKIVVTAIFPFMILYGFYIQFFGEISPGGGFQAGAIFASAIIAYDIIFASEQTEMDWSILYKFAISGVAIYLLVGFVAILFGKNFLNYNYLSFDNQEAQNLGIFLIEVGVGLTVAGVLSIIYFSFNNRE